MKPKTSLVILAAFACLLLCAFNRAGIRIPGASTAFPDTHTGFVAKQTISATVAVSTPVDVRTQHYGEPVAGTEWTGCDTDTLADEDVPKLIQERLNQELASSKLFLPPESQSADHLVLKSEIRAFCSQVTGFLFGTAAGIVSIRFSLLKNDQVVWDKMIEHVVTDDDPEYTGSQVTFIEQAMRTTMSDSLRLVLHDLLSDLEQGQGNSGN
jgi:hypothetical protein